MSQLRLPAINPSDQVRPSDDRKEPAFWIRRLRVLRELKAGDEHIIRDIELRRGLNIIWASPREPASENCSFKTASPGTPRERAHSAGSCAMSLEGVASLRKILGDASARSSPLRGSWPRLWWTT